MTITARPADPLIAKMATLGKMTRRSRSKTPVEVRVGQRVELPSCWTEFPHTGTVTRVTPAEFRVSWDSTDRRSRQPRTRFWYSRFNTGSFMKIL